MYAATRVSRKMIEGKCNYLDDHDRNNGRVINEEANHIFFNMKR